MQAVRASPHVQYRRAKVALPKAKRNSCDKSRARFGARRGDGGRQVITILYYLPEDDAHPELGTVAFRSKRRKKDDGRGMTFTPEMGDFRWVPHRAARHDATRSLACRP